MKYELAIFDFDGTVLDTLADIVEATNYALASNNLPLRSVSEIRSFVGDGAKKLIERVVPEGLRCEKFESVFANYRQHYSSSGYPYTCPYEGIVEMLNKLKADGLKIAVFSNKPDETVQKMCDDYFKGVFDYIAGERDGIPRKPDPHGIYLLLEEIGIKKDKAVYVGDTEIDVAVSYNAGIDSVIVDWGFRDRNVLLACGAKNIVSDICSLYNELIK